MNTPLLTTILLLAHISLGDLNARIHYRQPRYQRPVSHHAQTVSRKASVDEPQRRTFVSALLMAEVQFLEGLLAEQQRENGQKAKQRPHKHSKGHPVHKIKYQRPRVPIRKPQPPKKYVSKLDPFRMLDAPDLTKEAYKAPGAETEKTTTVKYGELEHYNLGGYLPPPASDYKPVPPDTQETYQLPPVTTEAPPYAPPTTTSPPPPSPVKYVQPTPAPAPAYHQPPAPAPAYHQPPAPAYEAPVQAPTYEVPAKAPVYQAQSSPDTNPHPHTFFHEAQAEKVHDGEWPTVYYNTFQGNQKTLIV